MIGSLSSEEIEDLLENNYLGRLACHAEGLTYIVPLSYAYDSGAIYVRTFEGMKLNMMRKNPQVCFEVDILEDMSNWKSVIAWGEFEELTTREERNQGLKILMDRKLPTLSSSMTKLSADWPFRSEAFDDIPGVIFRVFLKNKSGRFEKATTASFVNA